MSNTNMSIEEENRFVDHVETKLLSPVKESFTPSKGFLIQKDVPKPLDTAMDKSNNASLLDETDSGLSDTGNEHFVDRQESTVEAMKPDIIESPNKVVDAVFGFINAEAESLDAVNNNSESSMQSSDINVDAGDDVNANYETDSNQYLGKEVVLHPEGINGHGKSVDDTKQSITDETPVNLYWYKTNLDIDVAEIEAFKKGQPSTKTPSQSGYYKDSLYSSKRITHQDSNTVAKEKKSKEKDTWYSSFESVSSHCLDVASALKSEPKTKKNIENTSIKETRSNPPWGLEREDKVIEISEATDELPSILSELSVYVKQPSAKSFELDETDATGYIELKDKDEILKKSFKTEMQIKMNSNSNSHDRKDAVKVKGNAQKAVDKDSQDLDLDESDAVGYMEMKDKPAAKGKIGKTDDVDKQIEDKPVQEVITTTDAKVAYTENMGSSLTIETTEKYAQSISKQIVTSVTKHLDQDTSGLKTEANDFPDSSQEMVEEVMKSDIESVTNTKPKSDELVLCSPIEVKRKFKLSPNTEDQIKKMGGTLVETQVFVDEYLDDSSYSILLHDCWLRLRNKVFQMKLRSTAQGKSMSYPETSEEAEIKEALNRIFSKKSKGKVSISDKPLDMVIDEFGLTEFVTIETTRKTYQLSEYVIDLDLTSLGPQSGDIGVCITKPGKIVSQIQQLDDLAKQAGMSPLNYA